jgi:hypothetical protein
MSQFTAGLPINVSSNTGVEQPLPPIDPRTTEDCLFLDVIVPEKIFDAQDSGSSAAVLGKIVIVRNVNINDRLLVTLAALMKISLDIRWRIYRWLESSSALE